MEKMNGSVDLGRPLEFECSSGDYKTLGGDYKTLDGVLRGFIAGVTSSDGDGDGSPALFKRIRKSLEEHAPHLREASSNSAHDLLRWTREGSALRPLLVISIIGLHQWEEEDYEGRLRRERESLLCDLNPKACHLWKHSLARLPITTTRFFTDAKNFPYKIQGWDDNIFGFNRVAGFYAVLFRSNSKCYHHLCSHVSGSCWRIFCTFLCLLNSSLYWSIISGNVCHFCCNHHDDHCRTCSHWVDWIFLCNLAGCEEKHGFYKAIMEHHEFSNICIFSCRRLLDHFLLPKNASLHFIPLLPRNASLQFILLILLFPSFALAGGRAMYVAHLA